MKSGSFGLCICHEKFTKRSVKLSCFIRNMTSGKIPSLERQHFYKVVYSIVKCFISVGYRSSASKTRFIKRKSSNF